MLKRDINNRSINKYVHIRRICSLFAWHAWADTLSTVHLYDYVSRWFFTYSCDAMRHFPRISCCVVVAQGTSCTREIRITHLYECDYWWPIVAMFMQFGKDGHCSYLQQCGLWEEDENSDVLTAFLSYFIWHKFFNYVELSLFFYKTVNCLFIIVFPPLQPTVVVFSRGRHSSPYCCWSLWWISAAGTFSPTRNLITMRCSTLRGTFCSLIILATPRQDWRGSNPSRREGGGCGATLSRSHNCCAVRLVYIQISPGHIWTTLYNVAYVDTHPWDYNAG